MSLGVLSHEVLMNHCCMLLNTPIYRGGRQDGSSGVKKLPSTNTVLRKFAYLSSAINDLIGLGFNVPNECPRIISFLRNTAKPLIDC
jgi:hypothetical protein